MRVSVRAITLAAAIALFLSGATVLREPIAAAAQKAQEVFITNDAANAVPVREQARTTPVQLSQFAPFNSGAYFTDTISLYTVPAGKVLVIETVTVTSNMNPNDHLMHVIVQATYSDFIPFNVNIQAVDEGVFTSTNVRVFRSTTSTTAYAGPGTTVTAFGTRDGTALGGTSLNVAISGRLIDAP